MPKHLLAPAVLGGPPLDFGNVLEAFRTAPEALQINDSSHLFLEVARGSTGIVVAKTLHTNRGPRIRCKRLDVVEDNEDTVVVERSSSSVDIDLRSWVCSGDASLLGSVYRLTCVARGAAVAPKRQRLQHALEDNISHMLPVCDAQDDQSVSPLLPGVLALYLPAESQHPRDPGVMDDTIDSLW